MDQSERPRFYEGQYLGAADLSAGLDYGRVQTARHALGAHTWGIAVGLELVERALPSGDVDVSIMPGVAWDGYARQVVVLAPAKLSADKFANFQATTPPEGLLVKIWLRYDETTMRGPAPGFENCRTDDQGSRILESFAIEVGEPSGGQHGALTVASRSVDASNARAAFNPNAPKVYDESIPYQTFPEGKLPPWLIPIGYARWQKLAGQPGRLVARNDKSTSPDSDLIRGFRRYIGVIVETVHAVDGVIRMRDRWTDPDPAKTFFKTPQATVDPKQPPVNDLVWIEGHLRVMGDTRVCGGKLEFRDQTGSDNGPPLVLRRVEMNAQGGKDLQVMIGTDAPPTGKHALAVGTGMANATTGAIDLIKSVVVRDTGYVGIATETPTQLLTFAGDKKTRLEIGKTSATFPFGSLTPSKNDDGSFAINQQSKGSDNPYADFALMRDQKLRVGLYDIDTILSSQDGGSIRFNVNHGEPGDIEVARLTAAGNVGIGTSTPSARLDVAGRIVRNSQDFSYAGTIGHEGVVTVPWGTTADWNIFVSPNSMGEEEAGSEFDNAMLMLKCFATEAPPNTWKITAQYKFRTHAAGGAGTGDWKPGEANYLLVPR
jgi:hypothetical protein